MWTNLDWHYTDIIEAEDQALFNAIPIPDDASKEGESLYLSIKKKKTKVLTREEQLDADFWDCDIDTNGRLSFDEFIRYQELITNRKLDKGDRCVVLDDDQLESRYAYMCFLAQSADGPSLGTYKRLNIM